jgi:Kef-type K+ transport system membrane component KefB
MATTPTYREVLMRRVAAEEADDDPSMTTIPLNDEQEASLSRASFESAVSKVSNTSSANLDVISLSRSATQLLLDYGLEDDHSTAKCSNKEKCPFCSMGTVQVASKDAKGWELAAFNCIGAVILLSMVYIVLYLLLGFPQMAPGGDVFNLLCTWVCSIVLGKLVGLVGLPPLVGMIASGAILQNIASFNPDGLGGSKYDLATLPTQWKHVIRSSGLAVILLRSGLDLNINAIRDAKLTAFLLTVLPGFVEACTCALVAKFAFGFPIALAFALGFILAAVSPAVVVSSMLALKRRGYGVEAGIPSLVIAAASFDDVVAISGFSICMAIALQSESVGGAIIHGPLSIILGVVLGMTGAAVLSFTLLWNHRWKRTGAILILAAIITFGTEKLHMIGSAAMGSLVMGIAVSHLWSRGKPSMFAKQTSTIAGAVYVDQTEKDLEALWSLVNEPLLFGVIGSALDFKQVEIKVQAVIIVVAGLAVRIPTAFLATLGKSLTVKERIFVSLAWIPKATVQAALCSVPLEYVEKLFTSTDPERLMYVNWAKDIQATAVLAILLSAPLGLILINFFGKRLLTTNREANPKQNTPHADNIDEATIVDADTD